MSGKTPTRFDRLIDVSGDGFLLGAATGSAFHFVKGLAAGSVTGGGGGGRLAGAARAVFANAPRVAGSCGAYAAVYCASKSAVAIARRMDDDPWNAVAGGAASGGLLNARRGAAAAARCAAVGAVAAVAILGFLWSDEQRQGRVIAERDAQMYLEFPRPPEDEPRPWIIRPRAMVPRVFEAAGASVSTTEKDVASSFDVPNPSSAIHVTVLSV